MKTGRQSSESDTARRRQAPLAISREEFRRLGYDLVDKLANLLDSLPSRPVTPGETPEQVQAALGSPHDLPEHGRPAGAVLAEATELLAKHSLFNGHPRFWGYITAGPAPLGILAEMLAAAVNPNLGAWKLSPVATEIELRVVRWIAQLIGYPTEGGGLLVSGGNLANFVGFLAARKAKAPWDLRHEGMAPASVRPLRLYASTETHTWIHKAVDLFGLGLGSVRWIPVDEDQRLRLDELEAAVIGDLQQGFLPFLVVGNAGTVGTGAVDPLVRMAEFCRRFGLWFHVDGAYGGMAAGVPGAEPELEGLRLADSVAVDPHKWLYTPLEAGCVLVRHPNALAETFSHRPPYYHFQEDATNFYELGLQNSRGFRALKIWLQLQQAGRQGYLQMIGDDIRLADEFCRLAMECPELQVFSRRLSIVTFRYRPADLEGLEDAPQNRTYLDSLNQQLLSRLEAGGQAFVSNAIIGGRFALRLCIVNFRTSSEDIRALPELVRSLGRELDGSRHG